MCTVKYSQLQLFGRLALVCAVCCAMFGSGSAAAQPRIISVVPLKKTVQQYGTFEAGVSIEAKSDNPFDSSQIQVTGQFQNDDGNLYVTGGFLYQDFKRGLDDDGFERLTAVGAPQWRIRFTPPEPGEYAYIVSVVTEHGRAFSRRFHFTCEPAKDDGFVRTICGRYFQYDSGRPFFCIGQNLAWAKGEGTRDYDKWLEKLAESGANFVRLWLWRNPTFDLELMPDVEGNGGVGRYDLANAWRLDYVLDRCEALGIKVMLCFFDFHPLTEDFKWAGAVYHPWDNCVYNEVNGGPLDKPADFFSDDHAVIAARQLIRYVINRYGHSKAIMSWELFNEVDLAPSYKRRLREIEAWHTKMAGLVESLDPYGRPVTTSCAESLGRSRLWKNPAIRIVQSHSYNQKDMGEAVPTFVRAFDPLGKPHLVGEIGNDVNLTEEEEGDDPTALHLHNAIWAAMASGSAGGPLTWWWDSYIDPLDLYSVYTGPSKFAETIGWCAEEFNPAAVKIQMAAADIKEGAKPNRYVHGRAHKDKLGAGPTFEVDYAFDGTFSVHVDRVASDAMLLIYLDGRQALREELPASKARGSWKEIIWQRDHAYWEAVYDRTFAISVRKGKHIISVRNGGNDWLTISNIKMLNHAKRGVFAVIETDNKWGAMEFVQYKVGPDGTLTGYPSVPLRALALTGADTTIAWVQNKNNTWHNRRGGAPAPRAARGLLVFPGLGPGRYAVQRWNTYAGEAPRNPDAAEKPAPDGGPVKEEFAVEVAEDSTLQFITPLIGTDVAYKIERLVTVPVPPAPEPEEPEPADPDDAPAEEAPADPEVEGGNVVAPPGK